MALKLRERLLGLHGGGGGGKEESKEEDDSTSTNEISEEVSSCDKVGVYAIRS